jgi:hypothetical protein
LDVNRELEAIGKFSQRGVSIASHQFTSVRLTCVATTV